MSAIISRHNKSLLSSKAVEPNCATPPCNCRKAENCPLDGKCRESSIIYKATITSGNIAKNYYGCSETEFKARYYNHRQSFNHRHKSHATELSKAIWHYRDLGIEPHIDWSIMAKSFPYQPGAKSCNLCLTEKLVILQADPRSLLNKRSELSGKCRHTNKFKLKNFK